MTSENTTMANRMSSGLLLALCAGLSALQLPSAAGAQSPCADDDDAGTDTGCSDPTPYCNTALRTARCVACIDDHTGAGVDFGCDGERSFCDTRGSAPRCVYCLDTARGARDLGCSAVEPVCVASGGTNVCIDCENSAAGDQTDFGCGTDAPFCDDRAALASCVACLDDSHCAQGLFCNDGHQCATGCRDDSSCGGALPVCDESQLLCVVCTADDVSACARSRRGQVCVDTQCGCLSDVDCDADQICIESAHVCVARDELPEGIDREPDAGADAGAQKPNPDMRDGGATARPPDPIVRVTGGSKCTIAAAGAGARAGGPWAIGLSLLAAARLRRRSSRARRASR